VFSAIVHSTLPKAHLRSGEQNGCILKLAEATERIARRKMEMSGPACLKFTKAKKVATLELTFVGFDGLRSSTIKERISSS
jgi:hypothetical protein